jgi:HlyD family secretion protein
MKRVVLGIVALIVVALLLVALRPNPVAVEVATVTTQTLRAYVSEDAETRLDDEYLIDMPVSGTVHRITLEEGDGVVADTVLATVDPFDLQQ